MNKVQHQHNQKERQRQRLQHLEVFSSHSHVLRAIETEPSRTLIEDEMTSVECESPSPKSEVSCFKETTSSQDKFPG